MRMPLHRQCRQDGSPGAWRLRVCIAYAGPQKPHKMDLGLGSSNRLMAAKRAFWMLRALLAAGWVRGAAVYAGDRGGSRITPEELEAWRVQLYGPRRRRRRSSGGDAEAHQPCLPGL